jgi:hypothetical protein
MRIVAALQRLTLLNDFSNQIMFVSSRNCRVLTIKAGATFTAAPVSLERLLALQLAYRFGQMQMVETEMSAERVKRSHPPLRGG